MLLLSSLELSLFWLQRLFNIVNVQVLIHLVTYTLRYHLLMIRYVLGLQYLLTLPIILVYTLAHFFSLTSSTCFNIYKNCRIPLIFSFSLLYVCRWREQYSQQTCLDVEIHKNAKCGWISFWLTAGGEMFVLRSLHVMVDVGPLSFVEMNRQQQSTQCLFFYLNILIFTL